MIQTYRTIRMAAISAPLAGALFLTIGLNATFTYSCLSQTADSVVDEDADPANKREIPEDLEPKEDKPKQKYTGPPLTNLLGFSVFDGEAGPTIHEVRTLTPAWNAGVRQGDVIRRLAGLESKEVEYDKFLDFARKLVKKREEDDTISITVIREGKEKSFRITERELEKPELSEDGLEPRSNEKRSMTAGERDAKQSSSKSVTKTTGGSGGKSAIQQLNPVVERVRGGFADVNDQDYYFGSGGAYGSALTSSQQNKLDRLSRMRNDGQLTSAQQQEFDELQALEMGQFDQLDPLTQDSQQRLQELRRQARADGQLSADDRAELRQLTARDLQREGDISQQRAQLEQIQRQGQLSPQQQERLRQIEQLGPSAAERASQGFNSMSQLFGQTNSANLPSQQAQRLQQLAGRGNNLTPQQRREFQQLQFNQQRQMARQLRSEYQRARQLVDSGRQLSPQQQQRFRQLQQNRQQFMAGVNQRPTTAQRQRAAAQQQQQRRGNRQTERAITGGGNAQQITGGAQTPAGLSGGGNTGGTSGANQPKR